MRAVSDHVPDQGAIHNKSNGVLSRNRLPL
jgi:hypothetical protein